MVQEHKVLKVQRVRQGHKVTVGLKVLKVHKGLKELKGHRVQ